MKYFIMFLLVFFISFAEESNITEAEKAIFKSKVLIPSPAEIFMAMDFFGVTNWKNYVFYIRKMENKKRVDYKDVNIAALNVGVRVADAFLYIQANDKEAFAENAAVIKKLCNNLGVSSKIIKKGDAISELAKNEDWKGIKKELDGLKNSILKDITKLNDKSTATLTSIGVWIEGLHIMSKVLTDKYNPSATSVFRQPDLIDYFINEMSTIKTKNPKNEIISELFKELVNLRKLCVVEKDKSISKENVIIIYETTLRLVKLIEKSEL